MRSIRPSFILNVYLLSSVVFDIARSRSLSLQTYNGMISSLFSARVGIKAFLVILEAREKRGILLTPYDNCPPEATSGFYNRAFFWWQNSLFKRGFSNTLTVDDLFDLDKHLRSDYLQRLLQSSWEKCEFWFIFSRFRIGKGSLFQAWLIITLSVSDRQRTKLIIYPHSEEIEMAAPLCSRPKGCFDRLQLLSAFLDQQSYFLFSRKYRTRN